MLTNFLAGNFIALIILLSLSVTIVVNKQLAVPATGYFAAGILTLLIIIIADGVRFFTERGSMFAENEELQFHLRVIIAALDNILQPIVIMILAFIVLPNKKYLVLFAVPAAINIAVYVSACFGSTAYDLIDISSRWHTSFIGMTVNYTIIFYLFLLMLFSVIYFKWDEFKRSGIVLLIVLQIVLVIVLEGFNIVRGYTNAILAMGILEYYFYLSVIHQHEMNDAIMQKELTITKHKTSLLRTQMHPHFIINALSIIRSLVRRDTPRAVQCIDAFADYLKVHIRAIETDELIDFEQELRHVNAYLSLVQADRSRTIDIQYHLQVKDFRLPPLSLEPIIENAVKYGTGKDNGVIVISTQETDDNIQITVADNGTGNPEQNAQIKGTGIGIANTRQRLALQCEGTLDTEQTENGMTVTMTIPRKLTQAEVSL
ncbi:MAG: histidine kinase [Eubacterium sp.]|nr:histidine kinase [Eubacterium sp.]